jgi:UPF0271 protein
MLLNCDIGESFGAWRMGMDEHVMPLIDQANIACGFHAGDPITMHRTVRLALKHGVILGAHPAYPDLQGFGRRSMAFQPEEITALIRYQVGALSHIAESEGGRVRYVKPHGALYNDMMRDDAILEAVLTALATAPSPLALMAMATADYDDQGFIVPRSQPGAVHQDPALIVRQASDLAAGRPIRTITGNWLTLEADTLCVHGDNAESVAAVEAIRQALGARS